KKGKNREFALHDSRQILRRISSNLVLIFDIDVLAAELMRWLPDTDIHAAVVGLYPHSIQSNDPEGNRDINRLIGFIGNKPINLSAKNDSPIRLFDYTSSDLFDFEAKRRDVLLIPLFFKDEEFGIMLMPFNRSIPGDTYESLRVNISTAIKGAELINEIEYRNGLLNAVNDAATILLKSSIDEFESQLTNAMGVVARKINVGHMFIWQNTADGDAREARLMYEWYDAAENKPADGTQRRIVYQNGFQAWREALSAGECVSGSMSESAVKNGYGPSVTGFHAFLIAPILYNDLFWGFIGFNSPNQPRRYSDNDEMVLRSVSKLVANALLRQDMARNLQTSLEQVVEASRAKSDFLSNMSHEMRTPMNAIIGMTAIGKKAESADQKNRALNKIAEASSHLLGVINDVLDMSKIEANKLDLNRVTFDFRLMLQKVVTVIRFKLDEKHQAFSVNIDPELPRFMIGDDQRLAQVITNLLSNAVKFTHAGGSISLRVFIVGFADDTYDIGVEVKDNGIGIPVDKQEKIFEAFEQAESGTSRVYGGTGLGLVISKRIVELMQGTIRVESELGEGASFMFTVKLHTAKHPTDSAGATSANRMSIPAQASSDGGRGITDLLNDNFDTAYAQEEQALNTENLFMGKKMLLAEDIDINREILLAVLEETSIEVDCAANGREALEMVKANPVKYDIIFMDLQMPMMDGLEATRAIRALPQMKDNAVPIVAMTANVFKSDIEHCLDAGMNDHLGKPLDIQRVMETLRKYL
ncbi:MAG: ATP-binding protein, partial [Clostridia bacterium]|nr:ATP-binding protein [Clostridia bacterium]